jgi:hypothetical protein
MTQAKPYWQQYLNGESHKGEPERLEQITVQKGWLSPGSQIARLIEAGERLEIYRAENYDEFYYGEDEPSLDPIRTAEDIQDELLLAREGIAKMKAAEERLQKAHTDRLKIEEEKAKEKALNKQQEQQAKQEETTKNAQPKEGKE